MVGKQIGGSDLTPTFAAAIEQRWDDLLALVANRADAADRDSLGNTPLHYAAAWGSLPTVAALVDRGAPIGIRNHSGRLAEDLARERDHHEVASFLVCREHQAIPRPRRPRSRTGLVGNRFLGGALDGRTVDDVRAVALSGPWSSDTRRLHLLVAITGPDPGAHRLGGDIERLRPDLAAADLDAVVQQAGSTALLEIPVAAPHLLWQLMPRLLVRQVPIGGLAHRWCALDGWAEPPTAALATRPHEGIVPIRPQDPAESVDPPTGIHVTPDGRFVLRGGPDSGREMTTSWPALVEVGLARTATMDLEIGLDESYPWVAGRAAELRSLGVDGIPPVVAASPPQPGGGSALHHHLLAGRDDLAIDLVATGFPLERTDRLGRTALRVAVEVGSTVAVTALLEHGADPTAPDDAGRTPADVAVAVLGRDHPSTRLLLSR